MSDHPASPQPWTAGEAVHHDVGGWISGPSITAEPVAANQLRAGDVLLLDDGSRAEVTDVRHGYFWMNTGQHGPGVAIGWRALATASGVLLRHGSDVFRRILSDQRS